MFVVFGLSCGDPQGSWPAGTVMQRPGTMAQAEQSAGTVHPQPRPELHEQLERAGAAATSLPLHLVLVTASRLKDDTGGLWLTPSRNFSRQSGSLRSPRTQRRLCAVQCSHLSPTANVPSAPEMSQLSSIPGDT